MTYASHKNINMFFVINYTIVYFMDIIATNTFESNTDGIGFMPNDLNEILGVSEFNGGQHSAQTPIRIDAEDLDLTGYRIETVEIEGILDDEAFALVDYIEFTPVELSALNPTPPNSSDQSLLGIKSSTLAGEESRDEISSRDQLLGAISDASSGDVITLASDFSFQENVLIDKSVIIEGNGVTIDHSVPTSGEDAEFTPAFVVAADNVTIRNLTINGDDRNGENTLIELNNTDGTRSNNFTLSNVTLQNATSGLRNQGIIPSNLNVQNNTFRNTNKAIDLTRDAALSNFTRQSTSFVDTTGDSIFYQNAGSLNISNNRFFVDEGQPAMQVGIQIDAGNDGFNPDKAPGFPNNTSANRANNNDLVTNFNNAVIADNTGQSESDPIRATEFSIALAKVANVTVEDNFVETVGSSSDEFDFSSGINVEHSSRDVTIQDNNVVVNRVVNGDQNNQGISVLPFQDHGSTANSEEASVGVKILNNTITGSGRSGIFGLAFRNLEINGNNLSQFSVAREGLADINLFNTDDNGNGELDSNERATLTGSFTNNGASSNLGSSGLVESTQFNTEDPSDLPPDQRS